MEQEANRTSLKLGRNDVSNSEYHADREFLSSSSFKSILRNAESFYRERFCGEERIFKNRSALDEGSLTHAMILEPHLVEEEFVFFDGWRKQGAAYEQAVQEAEGRIVMSKPQRIRCESYVKAFNKQKVAVELLKDGESEVSLCTELYGVPVKMRADRLNVEAGQIHDVKTTGFSAGIDSFKLTCSELKYDLSAALYLLIAEKIYGKRFEFYFHVISKPEKVCDVYRLSAESRARGERLLLEAINKYNKCMETGKWVDYAQDVGDDGGYEILEV